MTLLMKTSESPAVKTIKDLKGFTQETGKTFRLRLIVESSPKPWWEKTTRENNIDGILRMAETQIVNKIHSNVQEAFNKSLSYPSSSDSIDYIKPHIRYAGKRHQASLQGFGLPKFTSCWNNFENWYSSDFLFRSLSNTKISQVIDIHFIYQSSVLVSLQKVFLGASGESRAPGVCVHDRRHSLKIKLRPAWSALHSSSLGLM